ncbi:MAG TPA: hypothetical protein VN612_12715 [Acidobacteriaceae bacterium]|nr:hypothetical protein [Acidobacteriaceae bacterium]
MSLKSLRISAVTLTLVLLGVMAGRSVPFHSSATATISQPANNGNGPGGGDPNPDCPDCVAHAL